MMYDLCLYSTSNQLLFIFSSLKGQLVVDKTPLQGSESKLYECLCVISVLLLLFRIYFFFIWSRSVFVLFFFFHVVVCSYQPIVFDYSITLFAPLAHGFHIVHARAMDFSPILMLELCNRCILFIWFAFSSHFSRASLRLGIEALEGELNTMFLSFMSWFISRCFVAVVIHLLPFFSVHKEI